MREILTDLDVRGTPRKFRAGAYHELLDIDEFTDVGALSAAARPIGDEVFAALQSGGLVKMSVGQTRGQLAQQITGPLGDRFIGYDDFDEFFTAQSVTDLQLGTTRSLLRLSGTGATVQQVAGAEFVPGVGSFGTGTALNGRCGWEQLGVNNLFVATTRYYMATRFRIPTASAAGQQFNTFVGFCNSFANSFGTLPTQGLYIRSQHGDTNFEAVNVAAGTETVASLGVPLSTTTFLTAVIYWDGTTAFYALYNDSGVLQGNSVTQSTNPPTTFTLLTAGGQIQKNNIGTTSRDIRFDWYYVDTPAGSRGLTVLP